MEKNQSVVLCAISYSFNDVSHNVNPIFPKIFCRAMLALFWFAFLIPNNIRHEDLIQVLTVVSFCLFGFYRPTREFFTRIDR